MNEEPDALILRSVHQRLAAASQVEEELPSVLRRLAQDAWRDPRAKGDAVGPKGKPAWWWKMRLIEWAGSSQAAARCDREALRAFRQFIRDLGDKDLCRFVVEALENRPGLQESA